ncbi:MAG: ABC transporter permease [Peptococcaceae bacterium]|nr:ABC transporter permease [Peptococcaceae bacterium]
MAALQAAFLNEIEKLFKKRKVSVALIISFLVIIAGQLVILGVRSGFGLRGVSSQEFPILVLSIVANSILPLFTALVTFDCFSSEFNHNIIRITLTRPVSRLKIFAAKVAAIYSFIITNLLLLLLLSTLAGFLFNVNSLTLASWSKILLAYLASSFPLLILSLLLVLLANIIKNSITVFFVSVILFLVLKAAGVFFSQYSGLLLTTYLDWYKLWLANFLPWDKILRQFCLMIGYGIMLFTAGFYLFDKKDY